MRSIDTLFTEDTRAVAPLIGFILLFGIGVLALSGYQAVQVPQQNAETEFQHYEEVQNDLTVVRNAISRAGQQQERQFESVRLGTAYRERIVALNPPAPTGTLRTSDAYNINIDQVNGGESRVVETRFLQYRNGYNELDIAPIYYDNSVLYLNQTDNGERVFFEDQNLVTDDGNITITALQREFSASSTGRVTLELYPTRTGKALPTGELNITLPTRLPEDYWSDQIGGEDGILDFSYRTPSESMYSGDVSAIEIQVNSSDLEFNTVGINDTPDKDSERDIISDVDGSNENTERELPGELTANLTKTAQGMGGGGSNFDWNITFTYDMSDSITVVAEANNGDIATGTIDPGESEITLILADNEKDSDIYPVEVSGENDEGDSCSAILTDTNETVLC